MKLTITLKNQIVKNIKDEYDHEIVEFLDDEFVMIHSTNKEVDGDAIIYPLLGHVCGTEYEVFEDLKFRDLTNDINGEFMCKCGSSVYPKKYKALYALHHLDI